MTTPSSTAIFPFDSTFVDPRRLALGGFLARYIGLTHDTYELDVRQFLTWCDEHPPRRVRDSPVRHRDLRPRLLAHSPAVHVRRPRIDYESHATALDRNEVGAPPPSSSPPFVAGAAR